MAKNKKTVQKVSNEEEPVKNEEKYLRVTGDPSTKVKTLTPSSTAYFLTALLTCFFFLSFKL